MAPKKAPKVNKKATDVNVVNKVKIDYSDDSDKRSSLYISEKELPAIKNWKIGQKYILEVEVEMSGIRKEDYGVDLGKIKADFKINKISTEEKEK